MLSSQHRNNFIVKDDDDEDTTQKPLMQPQNLLSAGHPKKTIHHRYIEAGLTPASEAVELGSLSARHHRKNSSAEDTSSKGGNSQSQKMSPSLHQQNLRNPLVQISQHPFSSVGAASPSSTDHAMNTAPSLNKRRKSKKNYNSHNRQSIIADEKKKTTSTIHIHTTEMEETIPVTLGDATNPNLFTFYHSNEQMKPRLGEVNCNFDDEDDVDDNDDDDDDEIDGDGDGNLFKNALQPQKTPPSRNKSKNERHSNNKNKNQNFDDEDTLRSMQSTNNVCSFLDRLPEANPIAKRDVIESNNIKGLFPFVSETQDNELSSAYLADFNLSQSDFSALLAKKEPLAPKSKRNGGATQLNNLTVPSELDSKPATSKAASNNGKLSNNGVSDKTSGKNNNANTNATAASTASGNATANQNASIGSVKQLLFLVMRGEHRAVYLRHGIFSNTVTCSQYRLNALRNGEFIVDKADQIPATLKEKIAVQIEEEKSRSMFEFDSEFESGNLSIVTRKETNINEFDLILQNDINTNGYTQWFFFRVRNKSGGQFSSHNNNNNNNNNNNGMTNRQKPTSNSSLQTIQFNLVNFYKQGSLFNDGMQVSIFSKKRYAQEGIAWFKGGNNISYAKNSMQKSIDSSYYTLSFTYTFAYQDDEVYFAYTIPYTYTQLNKFLEKCLTDSEKSALMYRKVLCKTLAGNRVDVISITNPSNTGAAASTSQSATQYHHQAGSNPTNNNNNKGSHSTATTKTPLSKRKGIVITARVHPGETVSSHIMEGVLECLLNKSHEAHFLREKFVFKIIPMLNPDGVVHGNYRCSLSGNDLNRRWKNPSVHLHPEIYHTKQLIFDFNKKHEIAMIIDIHGHSRKMNVFAYGCHDSAAPFECREYPFILSKLNQAFSFKDCNFKVQKNREGTARVALYKSLRIPNIFTMESSFCGPTFEDTHFNQAHLKSMGHSLCHAVLMKYEWQAYQEYLQEMQIKTNCLPQQLQIAKQQQQSSQISQLSEQSEIDRASTATTTPSSTFFQEMSTASLSSKKAFLDELYENPDLLQLGMEPSSGSDSEPSGDNLSDSELQRIFAPKKYMKNKNNGAEEKFSGNLTKEKFTTGTNSMQQSPKKRGNQQSKFSNSFLSAKKEKDIPASSPTSYSSRPFTSVSRQPQQPYSQSATKADMKSISGETQLIGSERPKTSAKPAGAGNQSFTFNPQQAAYNFLKTKEQKRFKSTHQSSNPNNSNRAVSSKPQLAMKNMVALEPKFVNFPLRALETPPQKFSAMRDSRFIGKQQFLLLHHQNVNYRESQQLQKQQQQQQYYQSQLSYQPRLNNQFHQQGQFSHQLSLQQQQMQQNQQSSLLNDHYQPNQGNPQMQVYAPRRVETASQPHRTMIQYMTSNSIRDSASLQTNLSPRNLTQNSHVAQSKGQTQQQQHSNNQDGQIDALKSNQKQQLVEEQNTQLANTPVLDGGIQDKQQQIGRLLRSIMIGQNSIASKRESQSIENFEQPTIATNVKNAAPCDIRSSQKQQSFYVEKLQQQQHNPIVVVNVPAATATSQIPIIPLGTPSVAVVPQNRYIFGQSHSQHHHQQQQSQGTGAAAVSVASTVVLSESNPCRSRSNDTSSIVFHSTRFDLLNKAETLDTTATLSKIRTAAAVASSATGTSSVVSGSGSVNGGIGTGTSSSSSWVQNGSQGTVAHLLQAGGQINSQQQYVFSTPGKGHRSIQNHDHNSLQKLRSQHVPMTTSRLNKRTSSMHEANAFTPIEGHPGFAAQSAVNEQRNPEISVMIKKGTSRVHSTFFSPEKFI